MPAKLMAENAHGHAGRPRQHADEHDAHAHDEHQQAAETEEHAHDEHRQGEDAALSSPDEHRRAGAEQFPSIECAVITVSDSRTELTDKSGAIIQSMLQEAGHEVVGYRLVKNDAQQITQALTHMLAGRARFVMLTGGTGPGTRDITVETVQSLLGERAHGLWRTLPHLELRGDRRRDDSEPRHRRPHRKQIRRLLPRFVRRRASGAQ